MYPAMPVKTRITKKALNNNGNARQNVGMRWVQNLNNNGNSRNQLTEAAKV